MKKTILNIHLILLVCACILFISPACHRVGKPDTPVQTKLDEDIVQLGMTRKEVEKILGKADTVDTYPDESHFIIIWYYQAEEYIEDGWQLGGLRIHLKEDIVVDVHPIRTFRHSYP